jgi:hypothetical protein
VVSLDTAATAIELQSFSTNTQPCHVQLCSTRPACARQVHTLPTQSSIRTHQAPFVSAAAGAAAGPVSTTLLSQL